eukprot:Pgem_evm1s16902
MQQQQIQRRHSSPIDTMQHQSNPFQKYVKNINNQNTAKQVVHQSPLPSPTFTQQRRLSQVISQPQ